MSWELSDQDKDVFRRAAERRKAAGVILKRFAIMADASQVEAINEIWESFVLRWGKEKAVDVLLRAMCRIETRMRDRERLAEDHARPRKG
jgi:hypothetical protein